MRELTKDDVPGMLAAAIGLAKAGERDWAPAWVAEVDVRIIAGHIGAADIRVTTTSQGWQMQCPACSGWSFGPTTDLREAVTIWLRAGRLPAAALLAGICMECEHATHPQAQDIDLDALDAVRALCAPGRRG